MRHAAMSNASQDPHVQHCIQQLQCSQQQHRRLLWSTLITAAVTCAVSVTRAACSKDDGDAACFAAHRLQFDAASTTRHRSPAPSLNSAILVSTSKFWFNYRHSANTLAVYAAIRELGVPDSRIILMLADEHACAPRNPHIGSLFHIDDHHSAARDGEPDSADGSSLYPADVEVDFAGADVTADALVRVITGRALPGTPSSKTLNAGPNGRLLLYLTGHGGDGFLKFSDKEELSSEDLASALAEARASGRFVIVMIIVVKCCNSISHRGSW